MEPAAAILSLTVLSLLGIVLIPTRYANSNQRLLRSAVTCLVGLQTLVATVVALEYAAGIVQAHSWSLLSWIESPAWSLRFYYDGATALMILLVSFVGLIVSRYSIRYLDGEATQGRYFKWLSFAIGAVSLMVVAGNLLLFFAAWIMTSLALHHLLLHYRHRSAAHRAAWTKFAISRLGDAFLIAAIILTYKTFGTFDLPELFSRASEAASLSNVTASQAAIAWLLMLGAVTKSAQFPFHTWLPDTMETPTPVSALMHAGIVNAGGYLVIRMSPVIALSPMALVTLAAIGAFTACFAGVIMMTQSSVKRTLAYSTIAQMGFMMLQCGLGAFSAAMLHILAHSLYKAHAFLSSGSVVSQALATKGAKPAVLSRRANVIALAGAAIVTFLAYGTTATVFGFDIASKPGGFILAFVMCLALSAWVWRAATPGAQNLAMLGILGMAGLCTTYFLGLVGVDALMSASVPAVRLPIASQFLLIGIAAAFCGLFACHAMLLNRVQPEWLAPLRVHAANGFYVDAIYHRLFATLPKS